MVRKGKNPKKRSLYFSTPADAGISPIQPLSAPLGAGTVETSLSLQITHQVFILQV